MCVICVCAGKGIPGDGGHGVTDMTIDFADVEAYAAHLREHGRKESTISEVEDELRRMKRLLNEGGRTASLDDIGIDDVRYLIAAFGAVKDNTVAQRIRILSRYSIWSGGTDWGKKLDILYNREEPDRVWIDLKQFGTLYKAAGPTDRMILVLGAFLGLRRAEMSKLKDDDIDLKARKMTVHGKGHGSQGLVVRMTIPPEVAMEIERYRREKAERGIAPTGMLLQSDIHTKSEGLSPGCISARISELGKSCGIHVTPHALRRLYATTLVHEVGADLETVRELMRHANIATTLKCYVKPDPRKQVAASATLMSIMTGAIESF